MAGEGARKVWEIVPAQVSRPERTRGCGSSAVPIHTGEHAKSTRPPPTHTSMMHAPLCSPTDQGIRAG
eukprot:995549-Prymnesium_polylepis.1